MPASGRSASSGTDDRPRRVGVLPVAALVLAIVAVALSAWAAFRPAPHSGQASEYTATQQADAKAAICKAADLVRKGVNQNTNQVPPGGEGDVTGTLAVAANARLAVSAGGQYLLNRLDPATPAPLADDVRKFANTLLDIGAAWIAGAPKDDPEQAARLHDADALNGKITQACK
jgi:hypothetical protein